MLDRASITSGKRTAANDQRDGSCWGARVVRRRRLLHQDMGREGNRKLNILLFSYSWDI